jgi:uncharacterized protein (TIGR02246 family)
MIVEVTWRHVGYAVLGAGIGAILGAGLLLAVLPALPAAEILELVRTVELFDPAEPRIRALEKEWVEAINAGDADRVVALFDVGGRILPPASPPVVGREAIRHFIETLLAQSGLVLETEVESVHAAAANDLAYSQGSYRLTWMAAAGEPTETRGSYAVVWGKREGEWRVLVDSFNSSAPARGAGIGSGSTLERVE